MYISLRPPRLLLPCKHNARLCLFLRRGAGNMAPARSRPVASPLTLLLLLTTLLACATAAAGFSVCDNGNCGKGHCAEVPGIIPTYKCECDPGWSQVFDFFPISPCIIPNCTLDNACFNITRPGLLPPGIPVTDICVAVYCGPGGTCKKGSAPFSYTCECQQGFDHVLNITTFPCVKHCSFGADCTAQGLAPPPPPPPSSPAPPGNHDSSGAPPAAPSTSPKGSVTVQNLLQLLLLLSVAMVQVV